MNDLGTKIPFCKAFLALLHQSLGSAIFFYFCNSRSCARALTIFPLRWCEKKRNCIDVYEMEPCIIFKLFFQFHLRRQPPPTTPTLNCRPSSITYKTRKISKFSSTLDDCSFPTNPINWNLWGMDGCHSH